MTKAYSRHIKDEASPGKGFTYHTSMPLIYPGFGRGERGAEMTEKELKEIYYINIEIKRLKKEKEELESKSIVKGQEITGLPGGGTTSDKVADYAVELAEIKELIDLELKRLYIVRAKIERYIETIEDSEVRLIIRLRAINNMTWEDIGMEIGMDRRTASRKYYGYLKVAHNAHG